MVLAGQFARMGKAAAVRMVTALGSQFVERHSAVVAEHRCRGLVAGRWRCSCWHSAPSLPRW